VGCGRIHFEPATSTDAITDAIAFEIGCADGTREGLAGDLFAAACDATWTGALDLRAAGTGAPCGNSGAPCTRAADACAAGWHLCAVSGVLAEIERIGADACANAGPGAWVAASSHCGTNNNVMMNCPYLTPPATYGCYPDNFCAEPICCGMDCDGTQTCLDAVFPGRTLIAGDITLGCGAITMSGTIPATGFLCCRD
jgi:hypothetical protein